MRTQINPNRMNQLYNATVMKKWRGVRAAANYMRKLGWSLEATLFHLLKAEVRDDEQQQS